MTAAPRTQDDMTQRRVGVLLGGWGEVAAQSDQKAAEVIAVALERRGHEVTRLPVGPGLDQALRDAALDVAFLAHHEPAGEVGRVQGVLELHQVPYTGAGALASAKAMDRGYARRLFKHHNLATAAGYVVSASELARVEALHGDLGFPCVVKSASGGVAFAPVLVSALEALAPAVAQACAAGGEALVERYVKGREVTVAILDGEVLGTGEVSGPRLHQPPRLSPTRVANLEAMALTAWRALDCRGVALVRFLCPEVGNEVLLDLDPRPLLLASALLPRLARGCGVTFEELCERLVGAAALDGAEVSSPAPAADFLDDLRHAS